VAEHRLARVPIGRAPLWAALLGTAALLGVLGGELGHLYAARSSAPQLPELHGEVSWTPGSRVAPASVVRGRTTVVAFLGRGCVPCREVLRRIVRRLPPAERPVVVLASASAAAAYGVAPGRRLLVLVDRRGDERTGYAFPLAPGFVEGDLRMLATEH
jgi:hypothetical protein